MTHNSAKATTAFRAAGLLCVLLISLSGFITAVHAHNPRTGSSERACSVCALAHSGVVAVEIQLHAPVPVAFESFKPLAQQSPSFAQFSSFYIRPPPAV